MWRFRPGQRVRLHVPVEELKDVFVLPAAAVVREGPEAFVFRQNGDLFDRRSVHVLHEDRRFVVMANDGSVTPGLYLAQSAAASLNRVLKAQAASGVHADVQSIRRHRSRRSLRKLPQCSTPSSASRSATACWSS